MMAKAGVPKRGCTSASRLKKTRSFAMAKYTRGAVSVRPLAALKMETSFPDAGDDSTGTTHRRAYDLLADGFGPGFNAPLLLVADLRRPGVDAAAIPALADRVAADPGIAMVGEPLTSPAGDTVVLPTIPTTAPADPETSETWSASAALFPPTSPCRA